MDENYLLQCSRLDQEHRILTSYSGMQEDKWIDFQMSSQGTIYIYIHKFEQSLVLRVLSLQNLV